MLQAKQHTLQGNKRSFHTCQPFSFSFTSPSQFDLHQIPPSLRLQSTRHVAGRAAHFSEQQLMDCSWDYEGNSACDGGNYDGALDYLIDAGGAVLDAEYEYLGQDSWCLDKNHSDTHATNLTNFKVALLCYWLDYLV